MYLKKNKKQNRSALYTWKKKLFQKLNWLDTTMGKSHYLFLTKVKTWESMLSDLDG